MKYKLFSLLSLLGCFVSSAQQVEKVDFTHLTSQLSIDPWKGSVNGTLEYTFDVLEPIDSVFIDAREMEVAGMRLNGNDVNHTNDGKRLGFSIEGEVSSGNTLSFEYVANPKQTMYFVGWEFPEAQIPDQGRYQPQVWTQGQGRYTSHWLPSFDNTREKVEFDLSIDFPQGYEVIANGKLIDTTSINDTLIRWEYDMENPMSSYLLALAAGKYEKKVYSIPGNNPLLLYYYQGDEKYVEPTYRYTEEMFDFLEEEIGMDYRWQNYKQIPVRDFLYSGMENTGTTIFSDFFMTDSIGFKDRNYVMVNAHELAHQWFGNLVTAKNPEDHWLQEGFATFYALLAEKEVFGEDHYYWQLFESAERLKELSDRGKGEPVIGTNGSSLTYYQKGAWVLHILRERLGAEKFRQGIDNYLEKYQFSSASSENFLTEMEKASGEDLSDYKRDWLQQAAFPASKALNSLKKSPFIQDYLAIAGLKETPISQKRELLEEALEFPVNEYVGQEVVHQLALESPLGSIALYNMAFETNNVLVRQAIAISLQQIPAVLKRQYESLLEDESYLTKEAALYNLWMNFPEERGKYLEKLKGIEGFYDKNIEILWLALNLATPEYQQGRQNEIYDQLTEYTSPRYPFYIRQNAFRYLIQLNAFDDESLGNLLEGTQHQVGRFKSFSRELLGEVVKNKENLETLEMILEDLPLKEREYLESILNRGMD